MKAVLKQSEKLADFGNGLRVRFNTAASKDYLITLSPADDKESASREMQKTLHLWCNEAGRQLGASHDYYYCLFKAKYLMPQMVAAGNKQATEKKELLSKIWESVTPEFRLQASGGFIRWSWASHEEVRLAMDNFKTWALTEAHITLTEPEKKQ